MKAYDREFLDEAIKDEKERMDEGIVADWYISGYFTPRKLKEMLTYLKGHPHLIIHNNSDDMDYQPEE